MKGMFFYEARCKERVPRVWPTGHIEPLLPVKDHLSFGHLWHVPQALRAVGGSVGDFFLFSGSLVCKNVVVAVPAPS